MPVKNTKLTISIPRSVLKVTDEIAQEKKITRSKLVAMYLEQMAEEYLKAEMAKGYKAMAEEQRQIAATAQKLQSKIVPEW
jgi:metal-responsive CopG/Arc/MetJ family transcriptional regulator